MVTAWRRFGRVGGAALTTIGAALVGACSLVTSWDDIPLGVLSDAGSVEDAPSRRPTPHDGALGEPKTADAALVRDATPDHASGAETSMPHDAIAKVDAGATHDAATAHDAGVTHDTGSKETAAPPACSPGKLYCGGHDLSGDPSTLYACMVGGSAALVGACSDGCIEVAGQDDTCRGAGDCVATGTYCGGDKVTGDPEDLYTCTSGSSGTLTALCANGCSVNPPGQDDECN